MIPVIYKPLDPQYTSPVKHNQGCGGVALCLGSGEISMQAAPESALLVAAAVMRRRANSVGQAFEEAHQNGDEGQGVEQCIL